jgi:predicted RNase H-like nuclease (RuvC/YqgF family)|tara:strand:+ start:247 stop:441 length:195 start_codon:yes stop_codon:yes gene_type:complete
MPTPEEKLNETQQRFDQNLAAAQQIEQQIAKLQEQLRGLQQPLIEDQGAIKVLKEILETVEQTA